MIAQRHLQRSGLRTRRRRWARPRCRTGSWCWSGTRSSACRRCSGWSWCGTAGRCLDCNRHRRTCLKEADRCIGSLWRLIAIEPEVIQRAPANRVRVLVLRERFSAPSNRACVLGNGPGRAAVTLIIFRAIICPTGLLWRSVEANITNVSAEA